MLVSGEPCTGNDGPLGTGTSLAVCQLYTCNLLSEVGGPGERGSDPWKRCRAGTSKILSANLSRVAFAARHGGWIWPTWSSHHIWLFKISFIHVILGKTYQRDWVCLQLCPWYLPMKTEKKKEKKHSHWTAAWAENPQEMFFRANKQLKLFIYLFLHQWVLTLEFLQQENVPN